MTRPTAEVIATAVSRLRHGGRSVPIHWPDYGWSDAEKEDVGDILRGCLASATCPVIDVTPLWDDLFGMLDAHRNENFSDVFCDIQPPWDYCIMGSARPVAIAENPDQETPVPSEVGTVVTCSLQLIRTVSGAHGPGSWNFDMIILLVTNLGKIILTESWTWAERTAEGEILIGGHGKRYPPDAMAFYVFDFVNARNIVLAEPALDRPARRRVGRTGVRVTELVITAIGAYRPGVEGSGVPVGSMPLTSVRGHYARYGDEYGRGKLFGKYEGKFWIPHHFRGDAVDGIVSQHISVEPMDTDTEKKE